MQYRPFKSKIIVEQVQALLNNVWMEKCGVPRGSITVLASKPHQEHILNIDDFIWRMCVYYRKLNSITNTFEFPILPCDDDISTFGAGSNKNLDHQPSLFLKRRCKMHDPGIQIIHQHRELKNCLMQEYAIQTVQIQDYSGTSTSLTQQCMDGKMWSTPG